MIDASKLSFSFTHKKLFSQISFEIQAGELLQIQGANGVGKSTLLMLIAGLKTPDSGVISFGKEKNKDVQFRKLHSTYLPAEANGLYLNMDALHNLKFWTGLRGISLKIEDYYEELEFWGLNHPLLRAEFPVGLFSTGMRRRLALARIALSQSTCWLLDEPIYGLDQKGIALFKTRLISHLDHGGIAVIISHDETFFSGLQKKSLKISHDNS